MEHVRAEFVEGMKKDMYDYFIDNQKYEDEKLMFPELFQVDNATGAYEKHTTVIGAGNLIEKPEGEQISYTRVGEGFTVQSTWKTYGAGLDFTKENVEDFTESKLSNLVSDMAATWLTGYNQGKESRAATVFNEGGVTTGHEIFNGTVGGSSDSTGLLCFDGLPFINRSGNNRPLAPGGTASYYNGIASGLTEANLQTAYDLATLTNAVNSRAQKVVLEPDVLLVHPSLRWTAKVLLETEYVVGEANNDINTVNKMLKLMVWRFLDTSTMWGLGTAKKGIKFWEREPLMFDFYRDEKTKGYKADVTARYGVEMNDWRYWVGSNVPTS